MNSTLLNSPILANSLLDDPAPSLIFNGCWKYVVVLSLKGHALKAGFRQIKAKKGAARKGL